MVKIMRKQENSKNYQSKTFQQFPKIRYGRLGNNDNLTPLSGLLKANQSNSGWRAAKRMQRTRLFRWAFTHRPTQAPPSSPRFMQLQFSFLQIKSKHSQQHQFPQIHIELIKIHIASVSSERKEKTVLQCQYHNPVCRTICTVRNEQQKKSIYFFPHFHLPSIHATSSKQVTSIADIDHQHNISMLQSTSVTKPSIACFQNHAANTFFKFQRLSAGPWGQFHGREGDRTGDCAG